MSRFVFVTLCACAGLMGQAPDLKAPGPLALPVAAIGTHAPIGPSAADGAGTVEATTPDGTVVTADIQAAIERHVEEQVRAGGGTFALTFGEKQLRLKLVRVHTEYLSSLGPDRQFACVDLADVSGDVYDVDFFLDGGAGAMRVTETTVHKVNGQPNYAWEQGADGTWGRIEVSRAADAHFGVIKGKDAFEFVYRVTLPEIPKEARIWLPLPANDAYQTVQVRSLRLAGKERRLKDRVHGNEVLYLELGPMDGKKVLEMRFAVKRREKGPYAADRPREGQFLGPERFVPSDAAFEKVVAEVLADKRGDLVRARALYDHVIDRMRYQKYGDGWGQGDAVYACDARTGNCTDFHSYFIALARTAGIPARFAIGVAIPSERNTGGIDGYHCWAEFYADGKWWPVDISEADKYTGLSTYYFGHHPANRLELSRGRDLVVDPGPATGPINFLAYPVLEVGGQLKKAAVEFRFLRPRRGPASTQARLADRPERHPPRPKGR
ncbi:MAG: transglutaminase-like domain-containing protein [Geothrix sp.]|nr:transglutaminase-like domain-containing protein [Geothrix sp.]